MERIARSLSRWPAVAALFALVAVNAALFLPAMSWVVPDDPGISRTPTITHLQLSWTSGQFRHNLSEWSSEACSEPAHCEWPGAVAGAPHPPPVADGPAGFRRLTLLLDYSFPVLYSLFAIGLTTRLWGLLDRRRRWLGVTVVAGVAAALCDLAENSIHLWLLRGVDTWGQAAAADYPGGLVAAASVLASVKYGILAAFVGAAVVWLARRPLRRWRAA